MYYETVSTRYKEFLDPLFFDEEEKEETAWERMGIANPEGEDEDKDNWHPIKIRVDQVTAISQEGEDVIIWTTGNSFIVDMSLKEAEKKFYFE